MIDKPVGVCEEPLVDSEGHIRFEKGGGSLGQSGKVR